MQSVGGNYSNRGGRRRGGGRGNGDFSDKRGGGGTHRGWEIGTVGWGVQGHFGSTEADKEAQVAASAVSSGNGLVRNEKGRWQAWG
jgi:hypothetical protein